MLRLLAHAEIGATIAARILRGGRIVSLDVTPVAAAGGAGQAADAAGGVILRLSDRTSAYALWAVARRRLAATIVSARHPLRYRDRNGVLTPLECSRRIQDQFQLQFAMTDRLYSDPDLVQFYDLEIEVRMDFDCCLRFAKDARSVLDLGCGTGQLAAALADGRSVTGVDPAPAMLDVARRRAGGQTVDWVEADARTVRLGRSFDLVILTGHAFQVFLTPEDRKAVLRTIGAHLAPGGRFIFDTRNPAVEEWLDWTPELSRRTLAHSRLGTVKAWNDFQRDPDTGVVTYWTHYELPESGQVLSAEFEDSVSDQGKPGRVTGRRRAGGRKVARQLER